MIVDGKTIADDIYRELNTTLHAMDRALHLCVLTAAPDAATEKYISLKKRKAEELGIQVNVIEFPENITTEEFVQSLEIAAKTADGVIVQLPLPVTIDTDRVLAAVPLNLDIDAVHYHGVSTDQLPPVVGAIAEIARRNNVQFTDQNVVVVGEGRLVGKPAALWATEAGAHVSVITKDTPDNEQKLKTADIIISGAGVSGLITPEVIKEGVVLFDAGTSEEAGLLKGDADPTCAEKAALFTPVPGGIGPITVAVLLRNLVTFSTK